MDNMRSSGESIGTSAVHMALTDTGCYRQYAQNSDESEPIQTYQDEDTRYMPDGPLPAWKLLAAIVPVQGT